MSNDNLTAWPTYIGIDGNEYPMRKLVCKHCGGNYPGFSGTESKAGCAGYNPDCSKGKNIASSNRAFIAKMREEGMFDEDEEDEEDS